MTRAAAIVCEFYKHWCIGLARTANFDVASCRRPHVTMEDKSPSCARLHCSKRIYTHIDQVFVIFICWTVIQNDHTTSIVSVAKIFRELKAGIGLKCSNLRSHSCHNFGFRCILHIYSQYRRVSDVCSFEIASTASMNMYRSALLVLDLRWMTWFVSMYTFTSLL